MSYFRSMKTPSRFGDSPRAEPYLQLGAATQTWPAAVGARFAALLDLFPSLAAAAEAAEVPAEQLTLFARGRTAPAFPVVARLADAAGVRLQWIWSGEEPMMRREALPEPAVEAPEEPAVDGEIVAPAAAVELAADYAVPARAAAAPEGGLEIESPQLSDALAFRTAWLAERLGCGAEGLFLFRVAGDEMAPTLRAGDLALCDRRDVTTVGGGLYAIGFGERILVRRIQQRLDGAVLLLCDDPRYQAETLHPDDAAHLYVLGRLVWHGRAL